MYIYIEQPNTESMSAFVLEGSIYNDSDVGRLIVRIMHVSWWVVQFQRVVTASDIDERNEYFVWPNVKSKARFRHFTGSFLFCIIESYFVALRTKTVPEEVKVPIEEILKKNEINRDWQIIVQDDCPEEH